MYLWAKKFLKRNGDNFTFAVGVVCLVMLILFLAAERQSLLSDYSAQKERSLAEREELAWTLADHTIEEMRFGALLLGETFRSTASCCQPAGSAERSLSAVSLAALESGRGDLGEARFALLAKDNRILQRSPSFPANPGLPFLRFVDCRELRAGYLHLDSKKQNLFLAVPIPKPAAGQPAFVVACLPVKTWLRDVQTSSGLADEGSLRLEPGSRPGARRHIFPGGRYTLVHEIPELASASLLGTRQGSGFSAPVTAALIVLSLLLVTLSLRNIRSTTRLDAEAERNRDLDLRLKQNQDAAMEAQHERSRADRELAIRTQFVDTLDHALLYVDRSGRIITANPAAERAFGYKKNEMNGISCDDLVSDPHRLRRAFFDTWENRGTMVKVQGFSRQKGGLLFPTDMGIGALQGPNGEKNVFIIVEPLTERESAEARVKYLDIHDQLTGLCNRNQFEQELARSQQEDAAPAILVCDVDGLRLINQSFSPAFGDRVLKRLASECLSLAPFGSVVSRIGEDEIAILVRRASDRTLRDIEERLVEHMKTFSAGNLQVPISISCGTALREEGDASITVTLYRAEQAMQREKFLSRASSRGGVVSVLRSTLEARDRITDDHTDRLASHVEVLAERLNLPGGSRTALRLLAQFHDIGKIGVPDHVLNKEGNLDEDEWTLMRQHVHIGYRIALSEADLSPIADLILRHHERWDGSGYPLGLSGEEIPLECRILAVADAWDAMRNDRPYRQALSAETAMEEIRRGSGTQFDPKIVTVFIDSVMGGKIS
jgi:diguanylate cyclase (GGDEF)-like protein/PAS domain S-box-containing protein